MDKTTPQTNIFRFLLEHNIFVQNIAFRCELFTYHGLPMNVFKM